MTWISSLDARRHPREESGRNVGKEFIRRKEVFDKIREFLNCNLFDFCNQRRLRFCNARQYVDHYRAGKFRVAVVPAIGLLLRGQRKAVLSGRPTKLSAGKATKSRNLFEKNRGFGIFDKE